MTSVSIVICLLGINQGFAQGVNLVKNPGFEDDTDQDGIPDGWFTWTGLKTPVYKLKDGGHSGKKAMTIECTKSDYGVVFLEGKLKVKPHKDYTLSFWYKTSRNDWQKVSYNFVKNTWLSAQKTDWTEVVVTRNSGEKTELDLEFWVNKRNNTLWIDDVEVIEGKTQARPPKKELTKVMIPKGPGSKDLIAGFETQNQLSKWTSGDVQFSLSNEHVTEGKSSCKAIFPNGRWPTMTLDGLPVSDWSGYEILAYDMYNPQDVRITIGISIYDTSEKKDYAKYFGIRPKTSMRVEHKIHEMSGKIDITRVKKLLISPTPSPADGTILFVDNVRLIPRGLTAGFPKGVIKEDNSPTFKWKRLRRNLSYRLQYSRDPAFAGEKTVTVNGLFEDSYTPAEPLANGKWYWRVRACETPDVILPSTYSYSKVTSFEINVPEGTDTTSPILEETSGNVLEGLQPRLRIRYRDDRKGAGIDLQSLKLFIDGKDVTGKTKTGEDSLEYRPASEFIEGKLYSAKVSVKDKAGNSNELSWSFRCYPPPIRVRVNKDNSLSVEGKRIFPFGFYGVVDVQEQDIAELEKAKFNIAQLYPAQGQNRGTKKEKLSRYLDLMNKHDQKVVLGVPDIVRGSPGEIARNILAFKDHPGVIGWYTVDEPEADPVKMRPNYELIKGLDPLPTCIVFNVPEIFERYVDVVDIFWTDPYPLFYWHKKNHRDHLEKIPRFTTKAINAVQNKKPVWLVPLSIYSDRLSKKQSRAPTFEEQRCMTYSGIVYGAKGVVYFGYNIRQDTVFGWPRLWVGMKCMAANIKSLSPILLSKSLPEEVTILPKDCGIAAILKEYKGERYLIAVNRYNEEVRATITIPRLKKGLYDLTRARELEVKNGAFSDEFKAYDVHIYTTAKGPQLMTTQEILEECQKTQELYNERTRGNVALYFRGADAKASSTRGPYSKDMVSHYCDSLNAIDDNLQTSWWPKKEKEPWLEVTLPGKHKVDRIVVISSYAYFGSGLHPDNYDNPELLQTRGYRLQYWDGKGWKTITHVMNNRKRIRTHKFPPVVTERFRFVMTDGRRLTGIEIYGSATK